MGEISLETAAASPSPPACAQCGAALPPDTNFCPRCGHDLRGTSPTSDTYRGYLPGTVIDDRYRILDKLGEGGMGTVFRVEHVRMGKVMALKMLRSDLALQPVVLERFRGEARIVSRLSHPNTISVFDFGEVDGGALYIAMEYVNGRDLARQLQAEGALPPGRAVRLGIQVLRSLEEAHQAGIVHRDIKPANVMVARTADGDDWAKVLDFGIAKLNEAQPSKGNAQSHITGVTEFVGTPDYCAPEQIRGQALDARTDLYALGAMLFELVSGKPPFPAPTPMAVISRHLADPPPRPSAHVPGVPAALDDAVLKALAKDPDQRFQSAREMRQALEAMAGAKVRTFSGQALPTVDGLTIASRDDWDGFERSLARGQRLRQVAGLLFVVSVLGGGAALGYRKLIAPAAAPAQRSEVEPNDDPAQATLMALDLPITGTMGAGPSAGQSDRDTYLLPIPHAGRLQLRLSGVADLNLVLELFDPRAPAVDPLAHLTLDDGRLGQDELLRDVPVQAGRYYVRVSERPSYDEPDPHRPPREREDAPYTLTAHLSAAQPWAEREPNDTASAAQVLEPGAPVLGHAGWPVPPDALERGLVLGAVDCFRAAAGSGAVALAVPPPGTTLGLWDARRVAAWQAKRDAFAARRQRLIEQAHAGSATAARALKHLVAPFPPRPVEVAAPAAAALALESMNGQVIARVAPLSGPPPTPDDAPYGLAVVTAAPGGMQSARTLAEALVAQHRTAQARALLEAALKALPTSADAPQVRSALSDLH